MSLTKEDLQEIRIVVTGAVVASEQRMTGKIEESEQRTLGVINDLATAMDAQFDKLDHNLRHEIDSAKKEVFEEIRARDAIEVRHRAAGLDDIDRLKQRVTRLEQARA